MTFFTLTHPPLRKRTDSPIKFPYNRSIDVEVHCAVIEYENEKAKSAHYLI